MYRNSCQTIISYQILFLFYLLQILGNTYVKKGLLNLPHNNYRSTDPPTHTYPLTYASTDPPTRRPPTTNQQRILKSGKQPPI